MAEAENEELDGRAIADAVEEFYSEGYKTADVTDRWLRNQSRVVKKVDSFWTDNDGSDTAKAVTNWLRKPQDVADEADLWLRRKPLEPSEIDAVLFGALSYVPGLQLSEQGKKIDFDTLVKLAQRYHSAKEYVDTSSRFRLLYGPILLSEAESPQIDETARANRHKEQIETLFALSVEKIANIMSINLLRECLEFADQPDCGNDNLLTKLPLVKQFLERRNLQSFKRKKIEEIFKKKDGWQDIASLLLKQAQLTTSAQEKCPVKSQ